MAIGVRPIGTRSLGDAAGEAIPRTTGPPPTTPSFVTSFGYTGTSTSVTINPADLTGLIDGDLLFVIIKTQGNNTLPTVPSGWTDGGPGGPWDTGQPDENMRAMMTRYVAGTTIMTIPFPTSAFHATTVGVYRNLSATPDQSAQAGAFNAWSIPALTNPVTAGDFIIIATGADASETGTANGVPTGFTQRRRTDNASHGSAILFDRQWVSGSYAGQSMGQSLKGITYAYELPVSAYVPPTGSSVSSTDVGAAAEAQSLAVALTTTDSGAGAETQSLVVNRSSADVAVGTESESVYIPASPSTYAYASIFANVVYDPAELSAFAALYSNAIDAPPIPHIWYVTPPGANRGETVTIVGNGLGEDAAQFEGIITLNSQLLPIQDWRRIVASPDALTLDRIINSDNDTSDPEHERIDFKIPMSATSGDVKVVLNGEGV